MKNALRRQKKIAQHTYKYETTIKIMRLLSYLTQTLSISYKKYRKIITIPTRTQLGHNYCLYTNRSRGIVNYSYGRQFFRRLYNLGLLTGYRKASW